jgi:hypothetical protein
MQPLACFEGGVVSGPPLTVQPRRIQTEPHEDIGSGEAWTLRTAAVACSSSMYPSSNRV